MSEIYCLKNLNVEEKLKEEGFDRGFITRHSVKWHFLLTKLILAKASQSSTENKNVCILTEEIKGVLGRAKSYLIPKEYRSKSEDTYLYIIIRNTLKKWGVISFYTKYKDDKAKVYYKLEDTWDVPFYDYKGDYPKVLKDNLRKKRSICTLGLSSIDKKLLHSFLKIKINKKEALEYLDKLLMNPSLIKLKDKKDKYNRWVKREFDERTYCYYKMYVNHYATNKFFIRSKEGRLFSNISSLPSCLRAFLTTSSGQPLIEIDVSNSQPLMLGNIGCVDTLYEELTKQGKFYNYLKKQCEDRGVSVGDNFKLDVLSKIYFGRNHSLLPRIEAVFQSEFPISYFSIRDIKRKNYKCLSLKLQREEAIQIKKVCKMLYDSKQDIELGLVHDSVLMPHNVEEEGVQYIKNVFYDN